MYKCLGDKWWIVFVLCQLSLTKSYIFQNHISHMLLDVMYTYRSHGCHVQQATSLSQLLVLLTNSSYLGNHILWSLQAQRNI